MDDIPIPRGVQIGTDWSPNLIELADWIGARDALRVCQHVGGEQIYLSRDPVYSPLSSLLGQEKLETLARVYGGTRFIAPVASRELRRVRADSVIAAFHAGAVSGRDGAIILGTTRAHMASLARSDAAVSLAPASFPDPLALTILKRVAAVVTTELAVAGASAELTARIWAAIMALWDADGPSAPTRAGREGKGHDRRVSVLDRLVEEEREVFA